MCEWVETLMMPQGDPFAARGTIALIPGCVALILLLGVNANGCATPQPGKEEVKQTASSFEFRPGVIVDPDRPAVYLMNIQGGIDAVDLVSGKLL